MRIQISCAATLCHVAAVERSQAWLALCLLAPSSADKRHDGQTRRRLGCLYLVFLAWPAQASRHVRTCLLARNKVALH